MKRSEVFRRLDAVQASAIRAINNSLKKNKTALVVMATGLGKTETAIKTIKTIKKMKGRHLWIVGRNNLVEQTFERFVENGIHGIGMLNGPNKDFDSEVLIASVQTMSKANILKEFNKTDFNTIWIDEAHHAAADSYEKVVNYFRTEGLIGLTATPDRPDYKNIYDIFGKPAFEKTFEQAQKLKVLAKDRTITILTQSTLEGLKTVSGDYSAATLDRLHTSVTRNETIVESYKKYGRTPVLKAGMKPKAICFCINVAHAKRMAEQFKKAGISADFLCASEHVQTAKQRQEIDTTFRTTSELEVICAVDLFNEGVDVPDANIAIMARPTRSPILYQQQMGRVARIDEGKKKFFVILDYVDNCRKGFNSYTTGNLDRSGTKKIPIVIEYLGTDDPVLIEERVNNYREGVNAFIKTAREEYDVMKISEAQFAAHFLKGKPLPRAT